MSVAARFAWWADWCIRLKSRTRASVHENGLTLLTKRKMFSSSIYRQTDSSATFNLRNVKAHVILLLRSTPKQTSVGQARTHPASSLQSLAALCDNSTRIPPSLPHPIHLSHPPYRHNERLPCRSRRPPGFQRPPHRPAPWIR